MPLIYDGDDIYEIYDIHENVNVCRLCAKSDNEFASINSTIEKSGDNVTCLINKYLPMINLKNNTVKNVCIPCISMLVSWNGFYNTCTQINEQLSEFCGTVQEAECNSDTEIKHVKVDPEINTMVDELTNEESVVDMYDNNYDYGNENMVDSRINIHEMNIVEEPMADVLLDDEVKVINSSEMIMEKVELDYGVVDRYPAYSSPANSDEFSENHSDQYNVYSVENVKYIPATPPPVKTSANSKSSTDLTCPNCDRKFNNRAVQTYHLNESTIIRHNPHIFDRSHSMRTRYAETLEQNRGPFVCDLCCRRFTRKRYIRMHIKWDHLSVAKFACDTCEWNCDTECKLANHRSVHSIDKQMICRMCGARCKLEAEYEDIADDIIMCSCFSHLRTSDGSRRVTSAEIRKARKVKPAVAIKVKLTKEELRALKEEAMEKNDSKSWWEGSKLNPAKSGVFNTNSRVKRCNQCGETFVSSYALKKHRREHGPKVECKVCHKLYFKSYIRNHMQIHSEVRAYVCDHCGKKFAQFSSLRAHQVIEKKEKNLICNQCGMTFALSSRLHFHMKSHLDVLPHVCAVCNKGFGYIWQLNQHLPTHSNDRPFKCDTCQKTYKTKKHLKQHWVSNSCAHMQTTKVINVDSDN